ncbi:hypothetical protein Leryth_005586 [Lithospermum erythrorhizon]|nr:hypothetical protein Leryth_005586 [Lithospermum erythrorhizon]
MEIKVLQLPPRGIEQQGRFVLGQERQQMAWAVNVALYPLWKGSWTVLEENGSFVWCTPLNFHTLIDQEQVKWFLDICREVIVYNVTRGRKSWRHNFGGSNQILFTAAVQNLKTQIKDWRGTETVS